MIRTTKFILIWKSFINTKQLHYKISYVIDFTGNILGKEIPDRIDIFKEFKETIPFELKQ